MDDVTPDSAETSRLLEQVRTGDSHASDRLFARHRRYLQQVVALGMDPRIRARVDPSDIVQETQMEAFRRLPDYLDREPMPFRIWLRKTAQEQLLLARRRHLGAARRNAARDVPLPHRSSVVLARQLVASAPSPSEQLAQADLARRIRDALGQLSDADREILLMRNFEGLSNREAAHVLGIEPDAASARHGRALLCLRKLLVKIGIQDSQP